MITSKYIRALVQNGQRIDGRGLANYRPITVEYGVSAKSAEGSARVTIGDTIVVAGVKLELGNPFPDKPDEGTIVVNVELLPLSSPMFETGPPPVEAIELARVVDRGLRESKAIDFKKLCVKAGEKVWIVFIDIYPINASGNLFDAAALAALAALKDAKFPKIIDLNKVDYKEHTIPFVLEKMPVECTVYKINGKFIIDPTVEEEEAADSRLTVAFTEDGKVCAMQKGGFEPITEEDLDLMLGLAAKKTQELRSLL